MIKRRTLTIAYGGGRSTVVTEREAGQITVKKWFDSKDTAKLIHWLEVTFMIPSVLK